MHETTNSSPTIFFLEEDNHARPFMTKSLRELGYRLLVSADLEDAFEWTSGTGYIHADLVLVNLLGKLPEEALTIGRRLREHSKYDGHTPLVILPERSRKICKVLMKKLTILSGFVISKISTK